jgi:outer membrane immunogenic protein
MNIAVKVVIAASLFVATPALAHDWSGVRLGVQGGFGQASGSVTGSVGLTGLGSYPLSESLGGAQQGEFGASVGYDWQAANGLVLGAVADINAADWSGSSNPLLQAGNCSGSFATCLAVGNAETSVDWYGTVRLKVGQSIGNLLVYGTGGLAYGNTASSVSLQAKFLGSTLFSGSSATSGVQTG